MREVHGKLVRETIDEVLDPDVCAVIAVDMQNDAMHPDGSLAAAGNDISGMLEILPRCQAFLAEARRLGVFVVHVQGITLPHGLSDSPSWIRAKGGIVSCDFFIEGTWGAEFSPEVAPIDGEPIVRKHRSSAFHQTDMDMILRARGVETCVVIGEQTPGERAVDVDVPLAREARRRADARDAASHERRAPGKIESNVHRLRT